MNLTVDSSVSIGEKPLSLINNVNDPQFPIRGVLEVVPAGTLAAVVDNSLAVDVKLSDDNIQHLKAIL
ncbi:hypothetical protein D3C85_1640650 [compost metagenome]